MKVFSGSANKPLAEKIAKELGTHFSPIEMHIFPDGERRIKLEEEVVGEDVVVVNPTSPPVEAHFMELFFILDAVVRGGANSATAVVPYLGYQRQDHVFRTGEARSLEVVIRLIETCGATGFIGLDFHSVKIPQLFHIPVTDLSAIPLFANKIQELDIDLTSASIVSPDMGGIRRIDMLSEMLGNIPTVQVEKNRDLVTGDVTVAKVHGEVTKNCIILDDMISSGHTINNAIHVLKENGGEKFFVFATHPVFSDEAPQLLQESLAEKVFVTDSIYVPEKKQFPKLEEISISQMVAKSLQM